MSEHGLQARTGSEELALRPILARGLRVSAVVGTALNLVNQGGAFLQGFEHIDPVLLALNFAVPFLVSVYSSVSAVTRAARAA